MSLISRSWLTAMQDKRGGKRGKKKSSKTTIDEAGFDKEHDYMEEQYIKRTFGSKSIGLGTGESKAMVGANGEVTQKASL